MEIRLVDIGTQPTYVRKNYYEFEIDVNDTFRGYIYLTRKEWMELKDKLEDE